MKKIILLPFAFAMLFSLTQCNNPAPEKLISNTETRGKIISALMNNDAYMNEAMDSMMIKHPDVILSTVFVLAKNDMHTQENMMDKMTDMCKMDSSMCKMMMGKTMEMCDMDKSKCSMMMGSLKEHPKGMQSMKDMGTCDMKGMDINHKK